MTEQENKEFIGLKERVKTLEKTVELLEHRKQHCDERRAVIYDRLSDLEKSHVRTEEKFKTGPNKGKSKSVIELERGLEKLMTSITTVLGVPQTPYKIGKGLYKTGIDNRFRFMSDEELRKYINENRPSADSPARAEYLRRKKAG